MTFEVDTIPAQLDAIQCEVLELNVGVSHVALDEERERNTRIRERIESIIHILEEKKSPASQSELEKAKRLLSVATGNTETLRYLESISCLEGIFTDAAKAATVTALDLSLDGSISQNELSTRFNHEANEIRAQARYLGSVSGKLLDVFSPDGRIGEAANLSSEMTERLKAFASLAQRAEVLTVKAPSILPVANRVLEVRDGKAKGFNHNEPLMAQLLINYVGSDFSVQRGDCLPLLDTTENPYLWKVQTASGPQYIPSISCIVASANTGQLIDAHGTLVEVKDSWNEAVANYKKQLSTYYRRFLESTVGCKALYVTDVQGQKHLMDDLDQLLVKSSLDDGQLGRLVSQIASKITTNMNGADEVWNRSELAILQKPLQILREHLQAIGKMEENSSLYYVKIGEYVTSITAEARGFGTQLETLRASHERSRAELKELYSRVHNWKSAYEMSIDGPAFGVGRLLMSSQSSSSGVSSDHYGPIPLPPSPLGRITPTDFIEETILGPIQKERSRRIQIHMQPDPEEVQVEKSRVFSGRTALNPNQNEASVSVKQKYISQPRMVRDVATQLRQRRVMQETKGDREYKYASTQSDSRRRVDCMTQIGSAKAPKAQQVDDSEISATMGSESCQYSIESGREGTMASRVDETYTTGRPKIKTYVTDIETRGVTTQDLVTQIGDMRTIAETSETATSPVAADSVAFEITPALTTGSYATKGRRKTDTMTLIHSNPPSVRGVDAESQNAYARMVSAAHNGERRLVHQVARNSLPFEGGCVSQNPNGKALGSWTVGYIRDSAYGELKTSEPSLSDTEMQTNAPMGVQMTTSFHQRMRVAAECTCVASDANETLTSNISTITSYSCPIHSPVAFHFAEPCYAQCETPLKYAHGFTSHHADTVSCQVGTRLVPKEVKVSAISVKVDSNMVAGRLDVPMNSLLCPASVECHSVLTEDSGIKIADLRDVRELQLQSSKGELVAGIHVNRCKRTSAKINHGVPETCVLEFNTSDVEMGVGSVMMTTNTKGHAETARRVFTDSECQFTLVDNPCGNYESMYEPVYASERSPQYQVATASCQVGTRLVPETIQVSSIPMQINQVEGASQSNAAVGSVVYPMKIQMESHLCEESGITLTQGRELQNFNVKLADKMYDGHFKMVSTNRSEISVCGPDTRKLCTLELNTCGVFADGSFRASSPETTSTEAAFVISLKNPNERTIGGHSLTCPTCHGHTQSSYPPTSPCIPSTTPSGRIVCVSSSSNSTSSVSTHVGTTLTPTNIQMVGVNVHPRDPETAHKLGVDENGSTTNSSTIPPHISPDYDRKPSFLHQRTSTPVSKTAECQVGTRLRPRCLQVCNLAIKPRSSMVAEHLGVNAESLMCPVKIQVEPELTELPGIEIVHFNDVCNVHVQAGEASFDADIQTNRIKSVATASDLRRRQINLMNIIGGEQGFTIGQVSPNGPRRANGYTANDTFTLGQIGCEIALRNTAIEAVCQMCQGNGTLGAMQSGVPKQFTNALTFPKPALLISKSSCSKTCQVGTVITPTALNVSDIEMMSVRGTPALPVKSIVYPAAVEVQTRLEEMSGIRLTEVAHMETVNVSLGGKKFMTATNQTKQSRAETCVLQIKSFGPEFTHGEIETNRNKPIKSASSSFSEAKMFQLNDIGCQFIIREEGTSTPRHMQPIGASIDSKRYPTRNVYNQDRKEAYCQVGTLLIPNTVQVADMSATVGDPRIAGSLGLKANAILCPSTVDLETRLTDASGITVVDVRDVKELGITVGDKKSVISIAGRNMGVRGLTAAFEKPDTAYLTFTSRQSPSLLETRTMFNNPSTTSIAGPMNKLIDQNAGCTFRVLQPAQPLRQETFVTKPLFSVHNATSGNMTRGEDAGCQVGVTLVPGNITVSPVMVNIQDAKSAELLGVAIGSTYHQSTLEHVAHISEKPGISFAPIDAVDQMEVQVGNEKYAACVNNSEPKTRAFGTSRPADRTYASADLVGKHNTVQGSISGTPKSIKSIGPYLVAQTNGRYATDSILEVATLNSGGKPLQLIVNANNRGKVQLQAAQLSAGPSGPNATGHLDLHQPIGSPIEVAGPFGHSRPNSRFCDVACEALIKPHTLEKRLQTFGI